MKHLLKIVGQEISTLTSIVEHLQSEEAINDLEIDLALRKVNDIYNELLMLKSSNEKSLIDLGTTDVKKETANKLADKDEMVIKQVAVAISVENDQDLTSNSDTSASKGNSDESIAEPIEKAEEESKVLDIEQVVDVSSSEVYSDEEQNVKYDFTDLSSDASEENEQESLLSEYTNENPEQENAEEQIELELNASDRIEKNEGVVEEHIAEEPEKAELVEEKPEAESVSDQMKDVEDEQNPIGIAITDKEEEEKDELIDSKPIVESQKQVENEKQESNKSSNLIADQFSDKSPSLNDMQASLKRSKDLASQFADRPIFHLKSAVKINDRIWFVNELFNRDADLYNETLSKVDSMNTLDEALAYLFERFQWDQEKKSTISFLELIFRRFANTK